MKGLDDPASGAGDDTAVIGPLAPAIARKRLIPHHTPYGQFRPAWTISGVVVETVRDVSFARRIKRIGNTVRTAGEGGAANQMRLGKNQPGSDHTQSGWTFRWLLAAGLAMGPLGWMAGAEPVLADPAAAEPALAEPALAEPALAEPALAEPIEAGEDSRAAQTDAAARNRAIEPDPQTLKEETGELPPEASPADEVPAGAFGPGAPKAATASVPLPPNREVPDESAAPKDDLTEMERVTVRTDILTNFERAIETAKKVNEFFSDERAEDEFQINRVRLRGDSFFRRRDGFDFDPGVNARIRLPERWTNNRLFLLFSGDFDEAVNDANNPLQADVKDQLEPAREENGSILALQAFLAATDRFNVSIQGGGRFRDGSPVGFIGPRYRQTFQLGSWALRATSQTRWFTDEGVDSRLFLDFERDFGRKFFLRLTPLGSWTEEEEIGRYGIDFALFHRVTAKDNLQYQLLTRASTEDNQRLENVVARVRYRRQLAGNWLFVELAPEISFPQEEDYDPTPAVLLRFDAIIERLW